MFLIAGVSPKTKNLDNTPRRCPLCGLTRAYYKRRDHYFNLFFIPVFRVKKGEPFIVCDRCERTVHEFKDKHSRYWPDKKGTPCNQCGRALEKNFEYCPFCGKPVTPKDG